jgi:hypothetical protein
MKYKIEITVTGDYEIDTDKKSANYPEGLTAQEMMDADIYNAQNYPLDLLDCCNNLKLTGKLIKIEE